MLNDIMKILAKILLVEELEIGTVIDDSIVDTFWIFHIRLPSEKQGIIAGIKHGTTCKSILIPDYRKTFYVFRKNLESTYSQYLYDNNCDDLSDILVNASWLSYVSGVGYDSPIYDLTIHTLNPRSKLSISFTFGKQFDIIVAEFFSFAQTLIAENKDNEVTAFVAEWALYVVR